jgi:hypothetical protein
MYTSAPLGWEKISALAIAGDAEEGVRAADTCAVVPAMICVAVV